MLESTEFTSTAQPKQKLIEGDIGGYPILQYPKKNRQIPKYGVKNRRNTNTAFMIRHDYLKLNPPCVFVYLKHVYTRNQPQLSRENVGRLRINWYNDRKAWSLDVLAISSWSNCQKLRNHLPLSQKSSKYWLTIDRRGQMNGTPISWRIFFYQILLARRMKNRILQNWMIPQYHTLKSKLLK